jgi:hypothetical protein
MVCPKNAGQLSLTHVFETSTLASEHTSYLLGANHMKLGWWKVFTGILLAAFVTQSVAEEYGWEEPLYVIVSSANARTAPRMDASVFVTLPIGTRVLFEDSSDKLASPNCRTEVKPDDKKWICFRGVLSYEMDAPILWIAADSLGRTPPQLEDLIARHDKTPKENPAERRKWAERAAALDPLNPDARKRLIDILTEIRDLPALAAAKKTFESYQAPQPSLAQAGIQRIFAYNNGNLVPVVAGLKSGKVVPLERGETADFHKRGQFYHLYSHGRKVGYVVTEMQFNCAVYECPQDIQVRYVPLSHKNAPPSGIATNFPLSEIRVPGPITTQQKAILWKMARAWIESSGLDEKDKKLFWERISKPTFQPVLDVGQYANDGRIFLVGNWTVGSMNDEHYGAAGDDNLYLSLLIIAEQQGDGSFRLANGSGSLADSGCSYVDHLDIDGDGMDEPLLGCEQLEGSHDSRFLKRQAGKWQAMF